MGEGRRRKREEEGRRTERGRNGKREEVGKTEKFQEDSKQPTTALLCPCFKQLINRYAQDNTVRLG